MTHLDDLATLDRLLKDRTMTLAECEAVDRVRTAAERSERYRAEVLRLRGGLNNVAWSTIPESMSNGEALDKFRRVARDALKVMPLATPSPDGGG